MAKIQLSVPHELEPSDARQRLQSFSGQVRKQFADQITSIDEQWDDENDSLEFAVKASGLSIKGQLSIKPDSIDVVSSLPFAALPFRGLLETQIRNAIEQAIAKNGP